MHRFVYISVVSAYASVLYIFSFSLREDPEDFKCTSPNPISFSSSFSVFFTCAVFVNDLKEIKCCTCGTSSITAPITTIAAIIFAGNVISAWHVFPALSKLSQWGSDKWPGLSFYLFRKFWFFSTVWFLRELLFVQHTGFFSHLMLSRCSGFSIYM